MCGSVSEPFNLYCSVLNQRVLCAGNECEVQVAFGEISPLSLNNHDSFKWCTNTNVGELEYILKDTLATCRVSFLH